MSLSIVNGMASIDEDLGLELNSQFVGLSQPLLLHSTPKVVSEAVMANYLTFHLLTLLS